MATTIEHLQNLNAYVPPPVAKLALENPHQPLDGTWRRFQAVTIFADISGFTPLAEALAANGLKGAAELNAILNRVFETLITTIESLGGQVVCFSGDALSLIWPCQPETLCQTAWQALQAAFAMQSTIAGFTIIPTSRGDFDIRMKIGLSAGEVLEVHAGGERGRVEYVLAGAPMISMSQAEDLAEAGEIVVDETIWQLTNGLDLDAARRVIAAATSRHLPMPESYIFGELAAPGFYRITHLWSRLPTTPLTYPNWSDLDDNAIVKVAATLSSYLPAAITHLSKNGHKNTPTKLRPMTVCFAGFGGIDYADIQAGPRLHHFLRDVQKTIYRYEGNINKLNVGDKGSILLALFGAPPLCHDDDEVRAISCALELGKVAARHQLSLRIGLASGPLFLGPLGAPQRREYTVIGDMVNLAARLMQKAENGQVLVDESAQRQAKQFFEYQDLGRLQVKGRTKPRRVYLALREKEQTPKQKTNYLFGQDAPYPATPLP